MNYNKLLVNQKYYQYIVYNKETCKHLCGGIVIKKKYFGIDINTCKFLGKGREGSVYLTPEGYALKIFRNKKNCKNQYMILKQVEGSKYFPKVLGIEGNCLLREYVDGISLKDYVKLNGMPRNLAIKLINLLDEFKNLGFTRIDVSSKNVYIENSGEVKLMDPRKSYKKKSRIPRILLSELDKFGVIDDFIKVVFEMNPDLATNWIEAIKSNSN